MTTFRLATEIDDELLRSILRENAMPTWVEMTMEREPSFSAGKNVFGEDWAVLAEEKGEVIGMYTASVLPSFVDGHPQRLGYLGGLRVRSGFRRRIRFLRQGYASVEPLAPVPRSVPWWFTVIASDNAPARRLLEAGVAGLPRYHALGEYVTFAISTAHGRRHGLWRRASSVDVASIVAFYNEQASRYLCSPVLDEGIVRRLGGFYVAQNFVIPSGSEGPGRGAARVTRLAPPNHPGPSLDARDDKPVVAVACLWDQRSFKQIVARRYRPPIGTLRPVYNLFARATGRIPLPREGGALEQTSIAFLAGDLDRDLLEDLLSHCETPVASLGLHARHPLIESVKRMRPIAYPARVYAVTFDGAPRHGDRPAQPEAALL